MCAAKHGDVVFVVDGRDVVFVVDGDVVVVGGGSWMRGGGFLGFVATILGVGCVAAVLSSVVQLQRVVAIDRVSAGDISVVVICGSAMVFGGSAFERHCDGFARRECEVHVRATRHVFCWSVSPARGRHGFQRRDRLL